MADLVITAANVVQVTGGDAKGSAGGTITAGQALYKNSTGLLVAAQANAATTDDVVGIALHGASSGQPIKYALPGSTITIGATVTLGVMYVLSAAAAGAIAPDTDLVGTNYVTFIGAPTTTAILKFQPITTSTQHP